MSPITVILTLFSYFALLFAVSYFSGRKADNAGFFVGNRQSAWYVVAFAMIGSTISGVTYVSVPGMVATSGFGYLQMVMGFVVGQVVIAFVLVPLFYRMNLMSIYGYLEQRFGLSTYRTGAWVFFVSKMLGASVRLFLVCLVLQLMVFDPLGLPFVLNVVATVLLVWLYTFQGGVKSLIWTDSLKTFCLLLSVGLCIAYMAADLGLSWADLVQTVANSEHARLFFFDDVNNKQFFWKQFLAGVFTMIATTGLDQDMMQRNLSCRNSKESQKNIFTSAFLQFVVISLFLILGVLLYRFAAVRGIVVERSDELFPTIATGGYFPVAVGILFTIGLISAAYSAAGSALTALTTSFTVDILGISGKGDGEVSLLRKRVHILMAVIMAAVIVVFNVLNNTSVINAVYILASYTYGPILGLFAFGILMPHAVHDRLIPWVVVLSPALCGVLHAFSEEWFGGYQFSYELLILNALFTFLGLCLCIRRRSKLMDSPSSSQV